MLSRLTGYTWPFASVILLLTLSAARGEESATRVSDTPFSDPARFQQMSDALPSLGYQDNSAAFSKKLATFAKSIGEASQNGSDQTLRQQASLWAFNHLRDEVTERVEHEGQALLSPYGMAELDLNVDMRGNFNGSGGQLLTPWSDNYRYLTFSQLGFHQSDGGMLGSAGVGQRWVAGNWLLGYNAFVDRQLDNGSQRASLGTEAWGNFLRFSANYYTPLSGWDDSSDLTQQRMARGYDITTRGYLPFYRQLGVSLSWERYLGQDVDLFDSGTGYHNPSALSLGVSYTPVPLVTVSATHKEASSGENQDQLGLKLNYRFGVALRQQLSADNVAEARSLRGSRYDSVTRSTTPVLEFRQRKTLSVFLATPPWQLNPGESLPLRLQIRATHPITRVSWQGDTQALSLTSSADNNAPHGWSIIMPQWDATPGASNEYHLSVTLEDSKQQRVTSNWITLKLQAPVTMQAEETETFDIMAPFPGAL